jgi:hypothetical protein
MGKWGEGKEGDRQAANEKLLPLQSMRQLLHTRC